MQKEGEEDVVGDIRDKDLVFDATDAGIGFDEVIDGGAFTCSSCS